MGVAAGAQISARIATDVSKTIEAMGTKTINLDKTAAKQLTQGIAAGQCTLSCTKQLAISASGNQSVDLSGALVDAFGDAAVFTKVKGFIIHNVSDVQAVVSAASGTITGNFITLGFGASSSWLLAAGEWMMGSFSGTGKTVTAATQDVITVTNNSGTEICTMDLIFVGIP